MPTASGEIGFPVHFLAAFSTIGTKKMSFHICEERELILFCHIPDYAFKDREEICLLVESHFLVILYYALSQDNLTILA